MKSKGLSQVTAITLTVAVSIVAVGILFVVIQNLLQEVDLSPEISCLDLQTSSTLLIENACYNPNTKEIEVRVKRGAKDFSLQELKFIVKGATESETFECIKNDPWGCEPLRRGETKTYYLSTRLNSINEAILLAGSCQADTRNIKTC